MKLEGSHFDRLHLADREVKNNCLLDPVIDLPAVVGAVYLDEAAFRRADLDSDGADELVADFGPGTGLRIYRDVGGAVWQWTTQAPPDGLWPRRR